VSDASPDAARKCVLSLRRVGLRAVTGLVGKSALFIQKS
jgi:hypothetical protein